MNDLWYYSILNEDWTLCSGNKSHDVYGKYNDSNNNIYPGSRSSSCSWIDEKNQKLWLFGGNGYGSGIILLFYQNIFINSSFIFILR